MLQRIKNLFFKVTEEHIPPHPVILFLHGGDILIRTPKYLEGTNRMVCNCICDTVLLYPDHTVSKSYVKRWDWA